MVSERILSDRHLISNSLVTFVDGAAVSDRILSDRYLIGNGVVDCVVEGVNEAVMSDRILSDMVVSERFLSDRHLIGYDVVDCVVKGVDEAVRVQIMNHLLKRHQATGPQLHRIISRNPHVTT